MYLLCIYITVLLHRGDITALRNSTFNIQTLPSKAGSRSLRYARAVCVPLLSHCTPRPDRAIHPSIRPESTSSSPGDAQLQPRHKWGAVWYVWMYLCMDVYVWVYMYGTRCGRWLCSHPQHRLIAGLHRHARTTRGSSTRLRYRGDLSGASTPTTHGRGSNSADLE
jgi:hypothetical protein